MCLSKRQNALAQYVFTVPSPPWLLSQSELPWYWPLSTDEEDWDDDYYMKEIMMMVLMVIMMMRNEDDVKVSVTERSSLVVGLPGDPLPLSSLDINNSQDH